MAFYRLLALFEMVRKHMVDVGGQRQPVMPDHAGDAHDAFVELRAHIRHLPLTRKNSRSYSFSLHLPWIEMDDVISTLVCTWANIPLPPCCGNLLLGFFSFIIFKSNLHVVFCIIRLFSLCAAPDAGATRYPHSRLPRCPLRRYRSLS